MTQFKINVIFIVIVLGALTFLGSIKLGEIMTGQDQTLRLTQNSEFVVEKVRYGDRWEHILKTSNLTGDEKINTLIVETDKPIGYTVGDTLRLLNYNLEL